MKGLEISSTTTDRVQPTLASNSFQSSTALQAEQRALQQFQIREKMLAATYGMHMPIRYNFEKQILSQHQRLPGLKSEMSGFNTIMRKDEDLSMKDYLNSEPMEQSKY